MQRWVIKIGRGRCMISILFATAIAGAPSTCAGMTIVGGWGASVPLVDAHNQVAVELKVDKGLLPAPLKVLGCDTTRYLVEYQGQKYAVDKVRVRYGQDTGPCVSDLGGKPETQSNANNMGLLDASQLKKCTEASKATPVTSATQPQNKK